MKLKIIFCATAFFCAVSVISYSQNIAVNTSGTAAASANMFEVTQSSSTNNTVGIFSKHSGAATNAYAVWAEVTGATNKYAFVVPNGGGNVGIGTITPLTPLHVVSSTINYIDRISSIANEGSCFIFRKARGTVSAPTTVQNGDEVGKWLAGGYDGTSYIHTGGISAVVNGAVSTGVMPLDLVFGINSTAMGNPTSNEAMRITNAKNVGIGTTAPTAHLEVRDLTSGAYTLHVTKDFNGIGNTTAAFIGGTDGVYGNTGIYVDQKDNLGLNTATSFIFNVVNNTVSQMLVTGLGNVGIGTTVPAAKLDVEGTHPGFGYGTGANSDAPSQAIFPAGCDGGSRKNDWPNLWGGGISTWDICGSGMFATLYSTRSDRRFKKDIRSLDENNKDVLSKFLLLRPVSYFINPDILKVDDPSRMRFGFIANEVESIFPDLVINNGAPENVTRGLEYDGFIPVLVNVVQEQQKVIEQLKNDKTALEARIERLENIVGLLVQTSKK